MSESDVVVRNTKSAVEVATLFLKSSVGAKVVMGLTGIGMWGFVLAHMLGNLQWFQGAESINAYGEFLQHGLLHGAGIWLLRAGLILMFGAHIVFGLRLASLNRQARPIGYAKKKNMRTNLTSLSMAVTGLLILAFLVFHILHFTTGNVQPEYFDVHDAQKRHDVYLMVKHGFQTPWVVFVYVVGQTLLLSHLTHGTVSVWQSLGFHHNAWSPALRVVGRALAGLIFAGNIGIPLSILLTYGSK